MNNRLSVYRVLSYILLSLAVMAIIACSSDTPEQRIDRARDLLEKREYRSAVIELKHVLKKDEKNLEARKLLGSIYLELGDGVTSDKEFQRYISHGGNANNIQIELARSYLLGKQYQKLLDSIRIAQIDDPEKRLAVIAYMGEAYLGLGKYDEAAAQYNQALGINADYLPARLGQAWVAIGKQDMPDAERKLKALTSANPQYQDAWSALAGLYRMQNKLDDSVAAYKRAIEQEGLLVTDIKSYSIRIGLIQVLLAKRDLAAADEHINAITNAYPRLPFTLYYRGLQAYMNKDYGTASGLLVQVTDIIPDYMPPYMLLGAIHYLDGNYGQANILLNRYLRAVPSNIEARKLLAAVHVKLDQNAAALDVLAPVLSVNKSDSQTLAILGEVAARESHGEQAIQKLMQAASKEPDNVAISNTLAIAYMRTDRYDEALNSLQGLGDSANIRSQVLKIQAYLHKSNIRQARKLARGLYQQQIDMSSADTINGIVEVLGRQQEEARNYFENAIQASPENIIARFYLARLELANGRQDEARQHYEQIISMQESYTPAYIGLAQLEQQQGNSEQALKWLKQAVSIGKDNITPVLVLANYYIENKDVESAREVLNASMATHPENEYRDILMARVYQLADTEEATVRYYKSLLDKYPKNSQVYIEFSAYLSKINKADQASQYMSKAIRINPDSLRVQSALSLAKLQEGDVDQALKIAKKIQTDEQGSSVGYVLAGDIYMSKSRYSEAKDSYTQALQRNPDRKILYKLFKVYYALDQRKQGRELLQSWINDHPHDRVAVFDFGNTLLAAKDWSGAVAQYRKVLDQVPGHVGSLNNIASAYMHIDINKALDYAKQAHDRAQLNPAVQDTLGWIYFKAGQTDKSLPLLEQAITKSRHPTILYHAASVYAKKGDTARARELLNEGLENNQYFEERKQAENLLNSLP